MIEIKSPSEIAAMRRGGALLAGLMLELGRRIRPGVSAEALDAFAEEYIRGGGAVPSFKGYRDYPATLCVSRNEVIVHGIPGPAMILREGDIVGIDVGAYLNGFHTDMAVTFPVGGVSEAAARLMDAARESLYEGIRESRPGNRVSDVSSAIGRRIERDGFSAVRIFVGHGVGRRLHEDPQIPNYGVPNRGPKLKAGMTMAIEPMVNEGTWEVVVGDDGWTARTADGKLSAHFEHTVAVGEEGPEILTVAADGSDPILALR